MRRALWILIALLVLLSMPAAASADGDPGSDVLVFQDLFTGADDNISIADQTQLGKLLYATTALHAPVRVAIIGQRDDLGSVTPFFGHPAAYAEFLGTELEDAYAGRLIVVMPQGVAVFWYHHGVEALGGIHSGPRPDQLVAAAVAAITRVQAAAGVTATRLTKLADAPNVEQLAAAAARLSVTAAVASPAAPTGGTVPQASATATDVSPVVVVLGLLVVLGAVFWAPPLWRRRAALRQGGIALPGLGLGVGAIGALVVLAVIIHSSGSATGRLTALGTNPYVDPGSVVSPIKAAPNFRLVDESGQPISLRQYRGKVVILSFTDDECQTICPLTTQAMVDARDSLGLAKRDVQLLGVDANWRSTQVQDVASYTQLHGLLGQWHFLTGTRPQLQRVWNAYGVGGDISSTSSLIAHTPAVDIIDPEGNLRDVYTTQSSYGAIAQFGQVLADEASRLLPSHPKVHTHYPYSVVRGISASTPTTLPKVGGGTVTLGTGKPHLYLFFASWDIQSTPIKAEMEALNAYARSARRLGLPPLTAIDEGAVEPNPSAVTQFLAGMHLDYPVAVDTHGRVADGYGVQGEPWFVLAAPGAANSTPWDQEVYTEGWPRLSVLEADVRGALKPSPVLLSTAAQARDLAGSPAPLARLHHQASRLLSGGEPALEARIRALRGYPVVVNIWSSACIPCQKEFGWFATASAIYGKRVAFLGADYEEPTTSDGVDFLEQHRVSYPSFQVTNGSIGDLLPGGVIGTPTTLFIGPNGKLIKEWIGQEPSEAALAQQVQAYALGTD